MRARTSQRRSRGHSIDLVEARKHDPSAARLSTHTNRSRIQPVSRGATAGGADVRLLEQHGDAIADSLDDELHRAVIVDRRDVPPDVVTMNSEVDDEDLATGARRAATARDGAAIAE
jgi:hypothetical protein